MAAASASASSTTEPVSRALNYDGEGGDDDATLDPSHVGDGVACCGIGLRALVSKKKRRFVDGGVDLDLSYITNRLIAMGYPSVGWESLYRNRREAVRNFLNARHEGHYRLWNLCSEREYNPGKFNVVVERFAWADHTPPPFAMLLPAAESLHSWLGADPDNVGVIHCKGAS